MKIFVVLVILSIIHFVNGYAIIRYKDKVLEYDKDSNSVILLDIEKSKDPFVFDGSQIMTESSLNSNPNDRIYLGGNGYSTCGTPVSIAKDDYMMKVVEIEGGKYIKYGIRKYFKSPFLARNATGDNVSWFSDVLPLGSMYDDLIAWEFDAKKMFNTITLFKYKHRYYEEHNDYTRITLDSKLYFSPDVGVSMAKNPQLTEEESMFRFQDGIWYLNDEFMTIDDSNDNAVDIRFVKSQYCHYVNIPYFVVHPSQDSLIYYGRNAYELVVVNRDKPEISLKTIVWDWEWFEPLSESSKIFSDAFGRLYSSEKNDLSELELKDGTLINSVSGAPAHIRLDDIKSRGYYGNTSKLHLYLEKNDNGWFLTINDPRVSGIDGEMYQLMIFKGDSVIKFKPTRSRS